MEKKKTLVLGASQNPGRYSNMAVRKLALNQHPVIAIGRRPGKIDEVEIVKGQPEHEDIDTVTLYLNPNNQKEYYDYILSLNPKRIIFNPGTENDELYSLAKKGNSHNGSLHAGAVEYKAILSCRILQPLK